MATVQENAALIVIDVQRGFDDERWWGRRDNPRCEENVAALMRAWRDTRRPLVVVRHESRKPGSPLAASTPGSALKDQVVAALDGAAADLVVVKSVHSAFYGSPDLAEWLRRQGVGQVVVTGIQTVHCVETTARMAADLGYDVLLPLDATHTFDRVAPDGTVVRAEDLVRATAAALHGEFAQVVETVEVLDGVAGGTVPAG